MVRRDVDPLLQTRRAGQQQPWLSARRWPGLSLDRLECRPDAGVEKRPERFWRWEDYLPDSAHVRHTEWPALRRMHRGIAPRGMSHPRWQSLVHDDQGLGFGESRPAPSQHKAASGHD